MKEAKRAGRFWGADGEARGPVDPAWMASLEPKQRKGVLKAMDSKDVAGVIAGMIDVEEKAEAVVLLSQAERAKVLEALEPHDVAMLLAEMSDTDREKALMECMRSKSRMAALLAMRPVERERALACMTDEERGDTLVQMLADPRLGDSSGKGDTANDAGDCSNTLSLGAIVADLPEALVSKASDHVDVKLRADLLDARRKELLATEKRRKQVLTAKGAADKAALLERMRPIEAAQTLEAMEEEDAGTVLSLLPTAAIVTVLSGMEQDIHERTLEVMALPMLREVLNAMSHHELRSTFALIQPARLAEALKLLSPEAREHALKYDIETPRKMEAIEVMTPRSKLEAWQVLEPEPPVLVDKDSSGLVTLFEYPTRFGNKMHKAKEAFNRDRKLREERERLHALEKAEKGGKKLKQGMMVPHWGLKSLPAWEQDRLAAMNTSSVEAPPDAMPNMM